MLVSRSVIVHISIIIIINVFCFKGTSIIPIPTRSISSYKTRINTGKSIDYLMHACGLTLACTLVCVFVCVCVCVHVLKNLNK